MKLVMRQVGRCSNGASEVCMETHNKHLGESWVCDDHDSRNVLLGPTKEAEKSQEYGFKGEIHSQRPCRDGGDRGHSRKIRGF